MHYFYKRPEYDSISSNNSKLSLLKMAKGESLLALVRSVLLSKTSRRLTPALVSATGTGHLCPGFISSPAYCTQCAYSLYSE